MLQACFEVQLNVVVVTKFVADLADASLVAVAESLSERRLFSFDTDFYIYRLTDESALEIIA